ncbi:hypothetical protein CR513_04370, partial [Mucuna pruriens]
MSPYWIVFGKACHLPNIELTRLSSNATWPTTKPENKGSSNYKNWTNFAWKPVRTPRSINPEEGVPSRPESKLCSRWDGPFVITNIFPYGVVELKDENTKNTFQVNGHQEGPAPTVGEMENISLMEPASPNDTPWASLRIPSVFIFVFFYFQNKTVNQVCADSGSISAGSGPTSLTTSQSQKTKINLNLRG